MNAWGMTANPVYGRAEAQVPVALFTTHEKALAYVEASRVKGDKRPQEGGYWRSFVQGSLLYDFNGRSVGDWHPPESQSAYWTVNPCLHDVQLVELVSLPEWTPDRLPVDPELTPPTSGEQETPK